MPENIGKLLKRRWTIVGTLDNKKIPKLPWDFPTTSLEGISPTRHHPVAVRDTGLCNLNYSVSYNRLSSEN